MRDREHHQTLTHGLLFVDLPCVKYKRSVITQPPDHLNAKCSGVENQLMIHVLGRQGKGPEWMRGWREKGGSTLCLSMTCESCSASRGGSSKPPGARLRGQMV